MNYENILKENGFRIIEIPCCDLNQELCMLATKNSYRQFGSNQSILCFIPVQYITPELVLEAVRHNGDAIIDIPLAQHTPEFFSDEILEAAVTELGDALRNIPASFITPKLCMLAVNDDGRALRFVPEQFISEQLILIALKTVPTVLECVNEKYLTDAVLYEYLKRMTALGIKIPAEYFDKVRKFITRY